MAVQNKLEEQLLNVSTIPKDVAEAAERAREKDRRTVAREEKLQLQKQDHVRSHTALSALLGQQWFSELMISS